MTSRTCCIGDSPSGLALPARIFAAILRHASGERTRSELLRLGDHEFARWHLGIVG